MPEPAIELRALTKTFERKREKGLKALAPWVKKERITAVDGVDLDIPRGQLFGLLGPNGAGKTTLVKLLATLLLPTSGTARVAGLDIGKDGDAVRNKVGVVLGGERALYWRLTARENLWYFSQLYNMPTAKATPRIAELLQLVGLSDRADERVENYSKGMKQRLHIARGLLTDPEILLLDEPTIGLDPHAARTLRVLVRDLVDKHGRTIVLTTHYMYEADQISDRVAIMNRGKIVACDTPAALKAKYAEATAYRVAVRAGNGVGDGRGAGGGQLRDRLAATNGVAEVVSETPDPARGAVNYRLRAQDKATDALPGDLARAVSEAGASLVGLTLEEPTLEDVFVRLTGEALAGGSAAKEAAP